MNTKIKTEENKTLGVKDAFMIIQGFISLKKQEKDLKSTIDLNKDAFFASCEKISDGANQIEFELDPEKKALLYTVERKKYQYSKSILVLEKELKEAKEKFESKNEPVEVTKSWAVKI